MKSRFAILCLVAAPVAAIAQPVDPTPSEPVLTPSEPPTVAPSEPAPSEPAPSEPAPLHERAAQEPAAVQEPHPRRHNDLSEDVTVDGPALPGYFADPAHHALELDLELFGTGAYTDRDGPALSEFRLDRGELGTVVAFGRALGGELRFESVRSAGQGGALGVQGDSIVIRVKRAQVFGDVAFTNGSIDRHDLRLHGALGITPDPWITALETDYPLRPLSATASERVLGWPTSDLGALARVVYGPVRASVAFGNGEGLDYPERNDGKTTTAVIEAVPFERRRAARLRVAGVFRDGSVGPARVRDRRFGASATLWTPRVTAGGELVQAYGIADRGDLEARALAGWAEVRPMPELALVGRATTINYTVGGGRATSWGGAVALEPWQGATQIHGTANWCTSGRRSYTRCEYRPTTGVVRLWLAVDRTTTSGNAMPIPGADAGNATTVLVIASTTAPFTVDP